MADGVYQFLSLVSCLILLQGTIVNLVIATSNFLSRRKLRQNALLTSATPTVIRRRKWQHQKPGAFWVKPGRTPKWWDNMVNGVCLPSEWKDNFRMSRSTFNELCDELRPLHERQSTRMRNPLSVQTQVAVTLYYLSDEGRYRKVANAFGISRSSVSIAVRNVCASITEYLGPKYIKLPANEHEVEELVSKFCVSWFSSVHWGYRWYSYSYKRTHRKCKWFH